MDGEEETGEERSLDDLSEEVKRKIGRNVLNFQLVEFILKYLLAHGKVSAYAGEMKTALEETQTRVGKMTLGQVWSGVLEDSLVESEKEIPEPADPTRAWFHFRFMVRVDPGFRAARARELEALVADRNILIHHLYEKFDPSSRGGCVDLIAFLDQQHERVASEYRILKTMAVALKEQAQELLIHFRSDAAREEILQQLKSTESPEAILHRVAASAARPDGWTLLSRAGQLLRTHAPEALDALKQRYGTRKLKRLVMAMGTFDIREEPSGTGGVLFRAKPPLE